MKAAHGLFVCAAFLAGCGDSKAWRDTTAQNRKFDEMRADELSCLKEVDDWQASTGIKLYPDGVVNRRALCMSQKGWVQNSN